MDNLIGHWLITDCVPSSANKYKKGIEGTSFELGQSGEVRWRVVEGAPHMPLVSCDTYEITSRENRKHYSEKACLRFGTYRGHILDFHLDTRNLDLGEITISKNIWLLKCKKMEVSEEKEPVLPSFTFLPALEDGYFADLEIVADNGKKFRAHTCILELSAPGLDWSNSPPPLCGLPEEVLGTTLHYLYAQCLPNGLPSRTAEQVLLLLADIPDLQSLRELCTSYLSHVILKNRILGLLADVHACATRMAERFQQRNAHYDPATLCQLAKTSLRDAAVAHIKLLLVSHLYHEKKEELTIKARQEVIRYIQSCVTPFLAQIKAFFSGLCCALNGLEAAQRLDLSSYLVPELEIFLDTAVSMLAVLEMIVEAMLKQSLKAEESSRKVRLSTFEQNLNRLLNNKELLRFDCFLGRINCLQEQLIQRNKNFKILSNGNKVRSLACSLDQLIGELPIFLLRLEKFAGAMDLKFEWNESQFCLQVATAKVWNLLMKLKHEKGAVQGLMVELCRLVDREAFSSVLVELGLLDASAVPDLQCPEAPAEPKTPKHCGYMLDLTDELCISPGAADNVISRAAEELLGKKQGSDMIFEVREGTAVTRMEAHRVIVAARCDWFRRALLSGMQEDIQRRIEIHNSTPGLFKVFLTYLYTGRLPAFSLSCSQLIELLVLGDCYEVEHLKTSCEEQLKMHLREESVLEVLDLAEQLNASILRIECIKFISDHRAVLNQEAFTDLSLEVQAEVYDTVRLRTGTCMCSRPGRWRKLEDERRGESEAKEENSSMCRQGDRTTRLQVSQWDSVELESAVGRMRVVVGHNTPRNILEGVILAAEFDLPRALDLLYFATSRQGPIEER